MTKFEFVNDDIYQVIAKYVVIDGTPLVMEMVFKMTDKIFLGAYGSGSLIDKISRFNRELYEDPLTGARNRRYFEEQLKSLDKMGAIAMIDVDNFKQINDSYGHVAGDAALCTIVRMIFEHVRADDVVLRYGGDEFLLMFEEIPEKVFQQKLEDIREEIAFYTTRIPKAKVAIVNVSALIAEAEDKAMKEYLQDILDDLKRHLANMESQLQALDLQMSRIVSAETSFTDTSHAYLKSFFQKRGLYLTQALLVVFAILILSRLSHTLMRRLIPGYRMEHRKFSIRMLDLMHRMITIALTIIGPMVVFYVAEDWVLFSLGVLLLLGAAWTLRTAIPRYWQQIRIYLNIGSVREGERIFLDGLPWRVKKIDIFTQLENPDAGISQRIAIENLVDLKSRPTRGDEPWFPCRKDDWVLLSDGSRGKVVGISQELIELVERGGARKTYITQDFLSQSPRNLSVNFRLKETIGVSYDLQSISTTSMLQILKAHLQKNIEAEGYGPDLLQLNVEFQSANTSSLDLVVLADFKGVQAPLYNRLRRAIQRWCVDACTENNWEIPFTQLTLHNRD